MLQTLRSRCATGLVALGLLCQPTLSNAQIPDKKAVKAAKISSALLGVQQNGLPNNAAPVAGLKTLNLFQTSGNTIAIEALAVPGQDGRALLTELQALGLARGVVFKQQVSGYLPMDKLSELENVPTLKFARPVYKPIHNVGAVTSQGDVAMRSNAARTTYGVSGAGVKVGILSDSYNNLGGAPGGVASGDLPDNVEVLADLSDQSGSDEGRAMAELIHDVAPGSPLAFHTAFESALDFAQGIRDLAAAGCKIITDDIFYFAEPFFQDGPIAQAVDEVVNSNGVTYFSSAGNAGRSSYQSQFQSTPFRDPRYDAGTYSAHNFSNGDRFQSLVVPPGAEVIISFQWDDPFYSVSGGAGAQTDMDLLVYSGGLLVSGAFDSNVGADPVEVFGFTNTLGFPIVVDLVLVKYAGPDPSIIKWVNFGSSVTTEYDTKSSTTVGHANSTRAIAVGAAPFYNTPAFSSTLTTATIEPFSSAGGTPILFDINGQRLSQPIVRQKPEITAVDGTNTTFFVADSRSDPDDFPNFFGTSAAAPHAAAVAALMQEKASNNLSSSTILSILEQTALDMNDPATPGFDTGFDFGTGYGFIQADKALKAVSDQLPAPLSITGVTTVSCVTVTAGLRTVTFAPQYAGPNGQPITFSVVNEILPTTDPGPYTINLYTDNPVITLKATQPGTPGEASFAYNWLAACDNTASGPDPGVFAITGVTTVSCTVASAGQRTLTFTPQYSGQNGQAITFLVVNETLPTTNPGPYSLNLYTDNPVITLKATQAGTEGEVSYTYNWLVTCGANGARRGAEPVAGLQVRVLGNPVAKENAEIEISGVLGRLVKIELMDTQGRVFEQRIIDQAAPIERINLPINDRKGLVLLNVRAGTEHKAIKLVKH
ncbi:S8 family serine peptidase [Spirosoma soli]|uniref:S8 family serine peptidase n=1 Tax=Spirosoma soli TaxID=1770529 RepID=A0ABW5LWZ6_9BACT